MDGRMDINLLRHVSILYACVEKLEVAGKEVPTRQVMSTATQTRQTQSGREHFSWNKCFWPVFSSLAYLWNAVILFKVDKTW